MASAGQAGTGELVGRDAELTRLRTLVDPAPDNSRVLVVLGDAGMGKSVLVADVAKRAGPRGDAGAVGYRQGVGIEPRVRRAASAAAAGAGHRSGLPKRQASALLGALGLVPDPVAPDRLLTGIAVLTLLSDLSEASPVLVVVDDAHWLDRSSLGALAFAGHRLDSEPVVLVLGARGTAPPAGFDRDVPELPLKPLPTPEAGRLLDLQPRPLRGRARRQVLAQAAGNPMALIELARAVAADPDAGRRWGTGPLPLTDRLTDVIAAQLATCPPHPARPAARRGSGQRGPRRGGHWHVRARAGALVPAERLGLIKVDTSGVRFAIPLSVPPPITARHSPCALPRTARSPRRCTASQTGRPGTWPRQR